MDGYTLHIKAYESMLTDGQQLTDGQRDDIQNRIEALQAFAGKSPDQIARMFDTSAFNEITKQYCRQAMKNAGVDQDTAHAVIAALCDLFDTVPAADIMQRII